MPRKINFAQADLSAIKTKLLDWSQQFDHVVWLDSNAYPEHQHSYEAVLAVDANEILSLDKDFALADLKAYREENKNWLFGYLGYRANSKKLENASKNLLKFPSIYFFQPKKVFLLQKDYLEIHYLNPKEIEQDWEIIQAMELKDEHIDFANFEIIPRIDKSTYIAKVNQIQDYIKQGKLEEINFCQEFYSHNKLENPLEFYKQLNQVSQAPFASYMRLEDKYAFCSSPERYLKHDKGKLITQPIKGTAKRLADKEADELIKTQLKESEKEINENKLVVDMVIQEFKTFCKPESVQVTEFCKAYSFKQVHQLISTIEGELQENLSPLDAISNSYPMGSMTGIPKATALVLTDELEDFDRGVYSGGIGYFTPEEDFDFNVVIRSALYNDTEAYLSFSAGGAITEQSNPEAEYDETLIKINAIKEILKGERK